MITLDLLAISKKAIIIKVDGQGVNRKRLLDLGLTPNTQVEIYKKAPFGDPLEIIVRGYHLSIRLKDAKSIVVRGVEC